MNRKTVRAVSLLGAVGAAVMPFSAATAAVPLAAKKTYTCSTNTDYGPVKVTITVANKKATITRVVTEQVLPKSRVINSAAVPKLKAKAVATGMKSAKVARIGNISGATETAKGFKGSLKQCLVKAHL